MLLLGGLSNRATAQPIRAEVERLTEISCSSRNLDIREERYKARRVLKQPLQLLPSSILSLSKLFGLRTQSTNNRTATEDTISLRIEDSVWIRSLHAYLALRAITVLCSRSVECKYACVTSKSRRDCKHINLQHMTLSDLGIWCRLPTNGRPALSH